MVLIIGKVHVTALYKTIRTRGYIQCHVLSCPLQEKLAALKDQGASPEEQERIMAEFERDIQKVQNQMDADRLRMQTELEVC